jgi:hypothetical protein
LGIKENLSAVKEELNTEEQFLEGLIRAERFYKKYKKRLIALAAILVVAFIGYSIKVYVDASNSKSANEAYLKLLKNPNNNQAANILKNKEAKLYYAYEFQLASKNNNKTIFKEIIKNSNDKYLSDLSTYQLSSLDGNKNEINSYINNSKEGLLKNLALLENAFLLLKNKKFKQAKIKLSSIEIDSPLRNVAKNLNHFAK